MSRNAFRLPSPSLPLPRRNLRAGAAGQGGFSLIEVSIVTAIILLIAVVGVPAVNAYVIENRVPRVAEELQRFVLRLKVGAQGAGSGPYAGVGTRLLGQNFQRSGVLSVAGEGDGAQVAHGLGGSGRGGDGVVTLVPENGAGDAFVLRLGEVNDAACPALASILQRLAEQVSVSSDKGTTLLKSDLVNPRIAYSAVLAQAACSDGDSNAFSFVFR